MHRLRVIAALIEGKALPVATAAPSVGDPEETTKPFDFEETARNGISSAIYARYKGHGLERLVAAVLEAQGYRTRVSPAGPDGGET